MVSYREHIWEGHSSPSMKEDKECLYKEEKELHHEQQQGATQPQIVVPQSHQSEWKAHHHNRE